MFNCFVHGWSDDYLPCPECHKTVTIVSANTNSTSQEKPSPEPEEWVSVEIERLKKELDYAMKEGERLAKVATYWQQEYYKLNPRQQPPKIDNL